MSSRQFIFLGPHSAPSPSSYSALPQHNIAEHIVTSQLGMFGACLSKKSIYLLLELTLNSYTYTGFQLADFLNVNFLLEGNEHQTQADFSTVIFHKNRVTPLSFSSIRFNTSITLINKTDTLSHSDIKKLHDFINITLCFLGIKK